MRARRVFLVRLQCFAALAACACLLIASPVSAQINFPKEGYYLSLGDSIAAGEGALPVTHGFVYQLYDRGVFGRTQDMDFSNIAVKGITATEVQQLQVYQALCILPPRILKAPTVITLTAGANDFFLYLGTTPLEDITPVAAAAVARTIADKVGGIVRSLVFGAPGLTAPCAETGLPDIRVMVFNYYSFDHPDPAINYLLNTALQAFSAQLQFRISQIQEDIQSEGKTARVGFVDTYSAMLGKEGLLLIDRRFGFNGPLDFEIHPTNAGHTVIAREFERVWNTIR
jgi:lysophospholipase L1-like esterase